MYLGCTVHIRQFLNVALATFIRDFREVYVSKRCPDLKLCLQEKTDDSRRLLNPDCNGRPVGSEKVQIS